VFDDRDVAYLAAIAPAVTEILRRFLGRTFKASQMRRLPDGAVVLVLTSDLQVRAQTAETEAYLRALVPPEGDRQPVPAGALNVGAQLLANEAGVDDHAARARVHLSEGGWLSLRASRMASLGETHAEIAVTIGTASSAERIDLFSRTHALSPREAELLGGLARGSDTRQLAAELYVSENTVQDHLKSIFTKTGARNRRALMARALGS
jgi:DNA-binding NarL/FixJ family response regulator